MREIRSVAYQYASQNGISGFSEKKKLVGYEWFVPSKVIGETGKPCYQSTATERGETVTAVAAFNALGKYIPTMLILRKRMKTEWIESIPKDVELFLRMSDKGWITSDLFLAWGNIFISQLPKDDNLPHIYYS